MDCGFMAGVSLGILAALMLNIGKGIQKQKVHVFLHGRAMFSARHRVDLAVWVIGLAMTAGAALPYSLGLKYTGSPSTISAMTGVGLIGLLVYALAVIRERIGFLDGAGIALVVIGTSVLGALGAGTEQVARRIATGSLVVTVAVMGMVAGVSCVLAWRFRKVHGTAFGLTAGLCIGLAIFIADVGLVHAGGSFSGQLDTPYPYIAIGFAAVATVVTQFGFLRGRALEVVPSVNAATILTPLVLELIVYRACPAPANLALIAIIVAGVLCLSLGTVAKAAAGPAGIRAAKGLRGTAGAVVIGLVLLGGGWSGCGPRQQQPAYAEVFELSGSAYQRGFQHGARFGAKIRSFYTTMIENSLVPYLNREQKNLSAFLEEYQKPLYADGQFSYQTLLQSGRHLEELMRESHPAYIEELHGVADGAGMPYEQILILNTFADTLLAFSAVVAFIRQIQAPLLLEVEFSGPLDEDGVDNNADGQIDEADDGTVKSRQEGVWTTEYAPRGHASMIEVPANASIRMVFWDQPSLLGIIGAADLEGERQGMDPEAIRIQLEDVVYTSARNDCIQTRPHGHDGFGLEVIFTPPGGLPPAARVSLTVGAGNLSRIVDPPPVHARFMRDERITFTTAGFGETHHQVVNEGLADQHSQPPAVAFAVRDTATSDGVLRLAHHFALLDADTAHKHCVVLIHRPDDGKAHVTIGWAGVIWGFAGMNEDGLTYVVTPSDTLNNPLARQVREHYTDARLLSSGVPIGLKGRRMLARHEGVDQARDMLASEESTFGWNFLLGDAEGRMVAVELDSNILDEDDHGFYSYTPDASDPGNLDPYGRRWSSVGPDDLRIGSHFVKNVPDIDTSILIFEARPQRYWSGFYYRSLRAHAVLGNTLEERYGRIDLDAMFDILRRPELVDDRNSMNAAVFEPARQVLHWAAGQVPATDGEFHRLDLDAFLAGGQP